MHGPIADHAEYQQSHRVRLTEYGQRPKFLALVPEVAHALGTRLVIDRPLVMLVDKFAARDHVAALQVGPDPSVVAALL